jgi:hypothetical protein
VIFVVVTALVLLVEVLAVVPESAADVVSQDAPIPSSADP